MRWLITGGCGFIGRNLVKYLSEEGGHYIRIVDNLKGGTREDLSNVCKFQETHGKKFNNNAKIENGVELIVGDILDKKLSINVSTGIDVIVHLAANTGVEKSVNDPFMDCKVNVIGTINYLEAARRCNVNRFVFASSGAPAGEVDPPIHEELAPHPVSPYGASKLAGEGYCSAYCRTFGVETVCLRFGNVYGPLSGNKNSVVAKFIKRALAGDALEVYGDGTQTRDFVYVGDLIDAILAATNKTNIEGEIFQIATNSETTIIEIIDVLKIILTHYGVNNVQVIYLGKRKGDVKRNFSDTSKALKLLKWKSKYELKVGLRKTVEWFLEFNNKSI